MEVVSTMRKHSKAGSRSRYSIGLKTFGILEIDGVTPWNIHPCIFYAKKDMVSFSLRNRIYTVFKVPL